VKSAQEVIERHVEVEIMLRQRALEAANAKIRWAETMRQAVVERVSQRTCEIGGALTTGTALLH